jgi:shikimate dehydrogenase
MTGINGKTKITGIIGNPVEHTLSPAMHNAAFASLKVNAVYVPFLVMAEDLGRAVEGLRALNAAGFNVTVPHKEKVIKYLDGIDALARKIGAVNTVVSNYGKLIGHNTDASGFIKSFKRKFSVKKKKVLLLGAGGAGKSIAFALRENGVSEIYVYDIDRKKAAGMPAIAIGRADLEAAVKTADMLVNSTPAGMREGPPPVNVNLLKKGLFVYDIVYNRETELIKAARKKGLPHLSGMDMLLYQGADAFELWTGRKAPVGVMRSALLKSLNK